MKRLPLIFVALLFVFVLNSEVRACQCAEYGTPVCANFGRSDAVFAGLLTDIKLVKEAGADGDNYRRLHFIVDQRFKGISTTQVVVGTSSGTSCDIPFKQGKRYLVYAWRAENDQIYTGACSGTGLLEHAQEDLDYLRKVTQQGVDESISGRLKRGGYRYLQGLRVTVAGAEKTLEATTNDDGQFSIWVPGPGSFKVRVFAPFAAGVLRYSDGPTLKVDATDAETAIEYEVKLEKNQCFYSELDLYEIDLHATAAISGHVLNESGHPLEKGTIYLVDATKPESSRFDILEKDGSFKYTYLPAGEYYLVMNPNNEAPGNSSAPYPTTYYPGVPHASEATRIVVTEGAKLENLTLQLGRPLRERTVSGTVVWHNRRVLKDVSIVLYAGDKYLNTIKVDKNGSFTFKIYGDFAYAIQARDDSEPSGESERLVLVDGKTTELKLILRGVK